MRSLIVGLVIAALSLWSVPSFAQQQRRYEIDPTTRWSGGAKQIPADEFKEQLDAVTVMTINVR